MKRLSGFQHNDLPSYLKPYHGSNNFPGIRMFALDTMRMYGKLILNQAAMGRTGTFEGVIMHTASRSQVSTPLREKD